MVPLDPIFSRITRYPFLEKLISYLEQTEGGQRQYDFLGHHLDVRENIKFRGRELARWIHDHYPDSACVLSVEFKKFFMDEWTGEGDERQVRAIRDALHSTVPGVLEELSAMEQACD